MTIKKVFRKKNILLVSLATLSLLSIAYIYSYTNSPVNKTPSTTIVHQQYAEQYSSFRNQTIKTITFSKDFVFPELKEPPLVYSFSSLNPNLNETASELAQKLKLAASSLSGFWTNTDNTETITQTNTSITYSRETYFSNSNNSLDISKAVVSANNFIELYLPEYKNYSIEKNNINYLFINGYEVTSVSDIENYNSVIIKFSQTLDQLPIRTDSTSAPVITISIDTNYQVYSAIIKPPILVPVQKISTASLVDKNSIMDAIKYNQGLISYLGETDEKNPIIDQVVINRAEFEYWPNPTNLRLEPRIAFFGTASTKNIFTNIVIHYPLSF